MIINTSILINSATFMSRTDEYGGSLENRMRYPLEVAAAVRMELPDNLPLFVRISGECRCQSCRKGMWRVLFVEQTREPKTNLLYQGMPGACSASITLRYLHQDTAKTAETADRCIA